MNTKETWDAIEGKMLELRILTNANWKSSEWEIAALGERVLRTVEAAKAESELMRANMERLENSVADLKQEQAYNKIFKV
jgi:hypothetical protein